MNKRSLFLLSLFLICTALPLYPQNIKETGTSIYVIPIHGEIDRALTVFIRRGIEEAKEAEASAIIFEIDTFGGRVDSALQISTLIGSAQAVPTVAFIPSLPEMTGVSWSAGALISFSCDSIYMAPGTSIGAAAPVFAGAEGMEAAPEKTVSAVRTQMASLAEKNGYPKGVALAMVDADVELLEVYVDGRLSLATADEFSELQRQAEKNNQVIEQGMVISKPGKLLTFTAGEMEQYGISSGSVENIEVLKNDLGMGDALLVKSEPSMPDRFVTIITGSLATTLLVMLGLVTLYLEITSPGFGIPGTIAIIAFALIFSGSALLGTVGSLEILLFMAGVILLAVEIFLIPGFGVTGVTGIVLITLSLILSRQDFIIPTFQWEVEIFKKNILSVGIALVGSIGVISLLFSLFRRTPMLNRLVLNSVQSSREGFTVQNSDEGTSLLGKQGIAVTTLRPAGKAQFDEEVLIVETEGDFLEKGTQVEIVEVSGNRIVVKGGL